MRRKYVMNYKRIINIIIIINLMHQILFLCQGIFSFLKSIYFFLSSLLLGFRGVRQGSSNYMGSNRILLGLWPHGPPPSPYIDIKLIIKNLQMQYFREFETMKKNFPLF